MDNRDDIPIDESCMSIIDRSIKEQSLEYNDDKVIDATSDSLSIQRIQSSNLLSETVFTDVNPSKRSSLASKRHSLSEPVVSFSIPKNRINESPRIDHRLSTLKELFVKNPMSESSTSILEMDKNNIFTTNLINECFVIQQNTLEKIEKLLDSVTISLTENNRSNMKRVIFITVGGLILNVTLFCINFFK